MKYQGNYETCVIGRGTCYTVTFKTESGSAHCSGFSAKEAYEQAETVVDLTTIPWEEACEFSINGPMQAPIEPGTTCPVFGSPEPWRPTQERPRLGNTGSFSYVATDVWLRIAASYGAHISRRGEPGFGYEAYLARHKEEAA
jgi:hypothetical protein